MNFFKTILISFLLGSVLMLTGGATINKHLCMGHLVSMAVNEEAHDCADIMGLEDEADPMGCCDDESQEIKADDFQKTSFEFHIAGMEMVGEIEDCSIALLQAYTFNPAFYAQYKPPLIHRDIPVLIQSFLI